MKPDTDVESPLLIGYSAQSGGAGIAMRRLYMGLKSIKPVQMATRDEQQTLDLGCLHLEPDGLFRKRNAIFRRVEDLLIDRWRTELSNTFFSLPFIECSLGSHERLLGKRVINLHWIPRVLSPEAVRDLHVQGHSLIWTLHDMNPFTGGCHFSAGCSGFTKECQGCPQLQGRSKKITENVLKYKERCLSDLPLVLVAPSKWMAGEARRSRIFRNHRIEVIPNGIDTAVFQPYGREKAARDLSLDPANQHILLGSVCLAEKRKGLDLALELIRRAKVLAGRNGKNMRVVTFGAKMRGVKWPCPVVHLGYISSEAEMAKVYSACDIFLMTSREDNLPNTVLEAMACALPVAAFDVGGVSDLVEHGETGFLAEPYHLDGLSRHVLACCGSGSRNHVAVNARKKVLRDFSLPVVAEKYWSLYQELQEADIGVHVDRCVEIQRAKEEFYLLALDASAGSEQQASLLKKFGLKRAK